MTQPQTLPDGTPLHLHLSEIIRTVLPKPSGFFSSWEEHVIRYLPKGHENFLDIRPMKPTDDKSDVKRHFSEKLYRQIGALGGFAWENQCFPVAALAGECLWKGETVESTETHWIANVRQQKQIPRCGANGAALHEKDRVGKCPTCAWKDVLYNVKRTAVVENRLLCEIYEKDRGYVREQHRRAAELTKLGIKLSDGSDFVAFKPIAAPFVPEHTAADALRSQAQRIARLEDLIQIFSETITELEQRVVQQQTPPEQSMHMSMSYPTAPSMQSMNTIQSLDEL